jgi:5'-nucleotidase
MIVLCTNDDGRDALGLRTLMRAAAPLGDVWTVAPDREQSATSHSLTLDRPLRVGSRRRRQYHVDGTPTDCVLLAVHELMDRPPEVVLSGVNHGANMGEDVLYSGTVAAAMEATLLGIPAVAVSYVGEDADAIEGFEPLLRALLRTLVVRTDFPRDALFNVNLPVRSPEEVVGVRFTRLGRRVYSESITRRLDPAGREYYWIGGGEIRWSGPEDADFRAVEAGYVSVTPLHLDLTHGRLLETVARWSLDLHG